ncbi:MAG: hypothetical protein LUG18_00500 [Candidatus Azobacteroides sp.]|nr:hypothetical protein [Candidatus Azobacteroides sp.]
MGKKHALIEERNSIVNELTHFKSLLLNKSVNELSDRYNYSFTYDPYGNILESMIKKIDMIDVHWFKNTALYQLTIDNGKTGITYSLRIQDNKIIFGFHNSGKSDIAHNATMYPSGLNNEFACFWEFEWNHTTLRFVQINVAG